MTAKYGDLVMSKITGDPIERVPSTLAGARIHRAYDSYAIPAETALVAGDTVALARVPSDARILLASRFYTSGLTEVDSPTLTFSIGVRNGDGSIDEAATFATGIDAESAGDVRLITALSDADLRLWEMVTGVEEDPLELLDIVVTLVGGDASAGGFALELFYTLD